MTMISSRALIIIVKITFNFIPVCINIKYLLKIIYSSFQEEKNIKGQISHWLNIEIYIYI